MDSVKPVEVDFLCHTLGAIYKRKKFSVEIFTILQKENKNVKGLHKTNSNAV